MNSDSEQESIEGDVNEAIVSASNANWGKAKYDYYYTDYIDKDYPTKLNAKEERLAAIEQEEALRIQKKLLSSIDKVDLSYFQYNDDDVHDNLIKDIEIQNRSIEETRKRKICDDDDRDESGDEDSDTSDQNVTTTDERKRRPINIAIQKNRGLTPYKKKEYRNPRVKHKMKYKKAMSKRRRNVREARAEYNRYSGEAAGIKTSTIRSIKLS